MPEVDVRAFEGILRLDIANDRQDGVVGQVVTSKEAVDIIQRCGVKILHRADRGVAIGMIGREGQGVEELHHVPVRHVVVALPLFLLHDLALIVEVFLGQGLEQRGHPVGLQPQSEVEPAGRQGFEVVGAIEPGCGIDDRAGRLEQPDVLARSYVRRALEHHVLEEMGESGAAVLFVSGTDVVPDVDRHRRRNVVGAGDDAEPVVQSVLDDRVAKSSECARGHAPHHNTSCVQTSLLGLGWGSNRAKRRGAMPPN
jgi:hypothetical protein